MPTPATPIVRLEQVTKQYGHHFALRDVDLDVAEGEFVTLLGPSGCGKTTTLRTISGFETPNRGEVYLSGQRITHTPAHRRRVNTVFQSYALFPHMSVVDNVAYGLRFDGVARAERRRRAMAMLERVGLADRGENRPDALSGGQMQRVALARALIKEPRVLLLDEPLSALDARLRKELQVELKRTQRESGITFIYVTHDQEEALTMSDRIAVMNHGRIDQIGTPDDVFERPASLFVARFVGASNELAGVREQDAGEIFVRLDTGERLRCPTAPAGRNGDAMRLIIRPEHVRVGRPGAGAGNVTRAVIEDVIYLGVQRRLLLRLVDGTGIEAILPASRLDDEIGRQAAGEVEVEFPAECLIAFDADRSGA